MLAYRDELVAGALHNLPPFFDYGLQFGAVDVGIGLQVAATKLAGAAGGTLLLRGPEVVLSVAAFGIAISLARRHVRRTRHGVLSSARADFMVVGAAVDLRLLLRRAERAVSRHLPGALLALPGLLSLAHALPDRRARLAAGGAVAAMLLVLWAPFVEFSIYPSGWARSCELCGGGPHQQVSATLVRYLLFVCNQAGLVVADHRPAGDPRGIRARFRCLPTLAGDRIDGVMQRSPTHALIILFTATRARSELLTTST